MASKLRITPADYDQLDQQVARKPGEFYSIVTSKVRGKYIRSIHVFSRMPMPKELTEFESTASKLKMRGQRTDVEGSQITAFRHLYDQLITRAYSVPVGWEIVGDVSVDAEGKVTGTPLTREQAIAQVPIIMKREALRDVMSEHYSESRLDDLIGDEEEVRGKGED